MLCTPDLGRLCTALLIDLFWIWNEDNIRRVISTSVIARHLGYSADDFVAAVCRAVHTTSLATPFQF